MAPSQRGTRENRIDRRLLRRVHRQSPAELHTDPDLYDVHTYAADGGIHFAGSRSDFWRFERADTAISDCAQPRSFAYAVRRITGGAILWTLQTAGGKLGRGVVGRISCAQ